MDLEQYLNRAGVPIKKEADETAYEYYDKDGNYIGGGTVKKGGVDPVGKKVYKQDNGQYSVEEPTRTSISINSAGKITVNAPSYVLEREGFKEEIGKSLETISRYYQIDPNYSIPMSDGSTKTAAQWLEELADPNNEQGLAHYAEVVNNMRKQEYGIDGGYKGDRETYKIGDDIKLNDRYFTLRNAIALGENSKDNARQAISDLPEFSFLRDLDSYDEATGTAELKDIMENGWNRDKHSDDELKNAKNALTRYFAKGDYSDTDQLARNIAMYEFITGRNPDVAWIRNVAETTGSFFEGAWDFFVDLGGYIIGGTAATITGGVEDITDDLAHAVFGTPDNDTSQIKKSYDDIMSYWEETKAARSADRDLLSDTQAGAESLGYATAKLVTLVSAGNAFSAGAKVLAGNIEASAAMGAAASAEGISLAGATYATTGEALRSGFATILSTVGPETAATVANVITALTVSAPALTITGLLAETFAESVTANPQTFYSVLNSGNLSEDAKAQLWGDFVGNSVGLAVGVSVGKGLVKAGETTVGRAISHNASRHLFKIQNKASDILDAARVKIHGVDNIADYIKKIRADGKIKKADAIAIDEMVKAAKREVANSDAVKIFGQHIDEIEKSLSEIEDSTLDLMRMNNAVDELRRHGRGIAAEWYSSGEYEAFIGTSKKFDSTYEALRKAEKASGVKDLRKVGRLAISQDSANYIQNMARRDIINSMTEAAKRSGVQLSNASGMKKELEEITQQIVAYQDKATPEMIAAAGEVLAAERKWAVQANNLLVREGLLSASDIADLRKSGMWGNNGELYVPLLREHHLDQMYKLKVNVISKNTIAQSYKYAFGKADDFLDPLAMSRVYMSNFAEIKARQDVVRVYTSLAGTTSNEVLSAAQTRAAKIASDGLLRNAKKDSEALIADIAADFRASGMATDLISKRGAQVELGKAVKRAERATESLGRETARTQAQYKATAQNMRAGVESMDTDTVNEVWAKGAGDVSVKDYVLGNRKNLPRSTKAIISEKTQEYRFLMGKAAEGDIEASGKITTEWFSEKTGYGTMEEWIQSEEFDALTPAKKRAALEKVFGKEKTEEIWESASDYVRGGEAIPEGGFRSRAEAAADLARRKDDAIKSANQRIRDIRSANKERNFVDRMQDQLRSTVDINTNSAEYKFFKQLRDSGVSPMSDAERGRRDIDRALEVNEVRQLRKRARKAGNEFTKEERKLLEKWGGQKLPANSSFDKDIVEAVEALNKANAMPSELVSEATVETAKAAVDSDAIYYAIANTDYGSEVPLSETLRANAIQDFVTDTTLTPEQYDELMAYYPELEGQIQRDIISGSKNFREMDEVQDAGKAFARENAIARKEMRLQQRNAELDELAEQLAMSTEQLDDVITEKVGEIVDKFSSRPTINKTFDRLAEYYGLDKETSQKYFSLSSMLDGEHKSFTSKRFFDQFRKELKQLRYEGDVDSAARTLTREVMERLQDDYDDMRVLLQGFAPELVDQKNLYEEVRRLAGQVSSAKKAKDTIVAIQDSTGEAVYIETDPLVASFISHESVAQDMNKLQRMNYLLSKTFRLGTTGIRIRSMVNQTFRDFGNAFIGGNVYRTWSKCVDEMRDVLGDDVVDWIRASDPELADYLTKLAKKSGEDVADVTYDYIKRVGEVYSPQMTETEVYRRAGDVRKSIRAGQMSGIEKFSMEGVTRFEKALAKAEDTFGMPNQLREAGLRNAVYRNSFTDAVKRGYSFENAKTYATFAMNNATTNFNRAIQHFSNMQDTVPFLGAAINGTKSFYRLLSVDPVGVMGRLMGGIVLPAMALTAYSTSTDKGKEMWRNLKEYEKDENLVFIVDGRYVTVPIPQEVAAIVNPFRHLVEHTNDANIHAYWQLAANDILGFSPIDLDGFMNIDANMITDGTSQNNFFVNNIEPGLAKLFAKLAPVTWKAVAMAVTGIDPFTMKKIDRSYKHVDPDTGESVVMNDYSGELGKFVAYLFKDTPFSMSAQMAEKVLGSIFGVAPIEYTGWLIELGQGVTSGSIEGFGSKLSSVGEQLITEEIGGPLYITKYKSLAQEAWSQFTSAMYERKEQLMMSDEWQDYMKQLRKATTQEQIDALKKVRENLLNPFYEDMKVAVNNLVSKYGAEFTAEKYAAVINLSVMENVGADTSVYGQQLLDELYQDSRKKAIHTMYELGFTAPTDYSAFGYITTDSNGDVYTRYSTPMAILDMRNQINQASNLHEANVTSILKANGLTTSGDAYRDMRAKVDAIYAKGKLSSADYDEINDIYRAWDVKVMSKLYPYIAAYGPDEVLSSSGMSDLLDDVIKVPSDYEVTNRGRFFSSSRLNKQRGFAPSYIKYLYERMGGE